MLNQVRPSRTEVIPENVEQIKQKIKSLEFSLYFIPDWDENSQLHVLTQIQVYRTTLDILEKMD